MTTTPRSDTSEPAKAGQERTAPGDYLNRELSWLEFNARVLHEALDPRTPLLERVKFLGIFSANLDEFFMKRVGGLKRQTLQSVTKRTPDGMTPQQQLAAIRQRTLPLLQRQADAYHREIRPALAHHDVHLLAWEDLTKEELVWVDEFFRANVFPVLTPLSVDPGHPFPFISNLTVSLGVTLRPSDQEEELFARIKVPPVLPQWVRVEGGAPQQHRLVSMLDIIRHNLDDLFPNMTVTSTMPFRVTRNADVEREEEDADDLLEMVAEEIRQRRFEKAIRLEHAPGADPWLLQLLMEELELSADDVYEMPAELDFTSLRPVWDLNLPELRYEPWTPVVPPRLAGEQPDVFSVIRSSDLLVHHPYEDFTASVERFVRAAAEDPEVLAIKVTVYRTGDQSPFMKSLIRAAEAGKQVVCLVELKARFDEERNIFWAHALEKAGVHVVYGIVGLKTHTKGALVVRREGGKVRCYAHLGTGNYHSGTARLYDDVGLFTCRSEITDDVVELFHYLTGRSLKRTYRKLLIAPVNMKERFMELIDREIAHAQAGRDAHIIAKMNSLEEYDICQALYRASAAGVSIDLIVRGFCCLRPAAPHLSDSIRVISVIGRFLEHSRIFYFRNAAEDARDGEYYIGSADWMYRNLANRVEMITPVEHRPARLRLWEILQTLLADQRQAWDMQSDGSYVQRRPAEPAQAAPGAAPAPPAPETIGSHQVLMNLARSRKE